MAAIEAITRASNWVRFEARRFCFVLFLVT